MRAQAQTGVGRPIARAAEALFAAQHADGAFPNQRPPAVLGTAGTLVALHLVDPQRSAELIERGARWLAAAQREDGGWGGVADAPTQLVPTAVAAAALRLVGPAEYEAAVARALDLVKSLGGVAALPDPGMVLMVTTFLELAGLQDAADAPRIPLERLMLPRRLWRARISFRLAPLIALALLQEQRHPSRGRGKLIHRAARRHGLRLLAEMERGENDRGGYGGDNWLVAVVCIGLHAGGAPRPMIDATLDYLRGNARPDGAWHIMQGLDLIGGAFAARGLADAGYARDPRLERSLTWLRGCRQHEPFSLYGAPPGGWGWEGPRGWPNFLDSANVLSALAAGGGGTSDETLRAGVQWLRSRQDAAGSWSTFVPNTTLANDGPCPYITAQCIEVLLDVGASAQDPAIVRAADWLLANQHPDGTFDALWYRGRVPGTAMVLAALTRAGKGEHAAARRAREALREMQLADGSWGPGATGVLGDDASQGTVEETAWALRALLVSGVPAHDETLRRAADWIAAAQQPDGLWPAAPIAMHIRNAAYYVDGLIVNGLALRALAAYQAATGDGGPGSGGAGS